MPAESTKTGNESGFYQLRAGSGMDGSHGAELLAIAGSGQ